MPSRADLSNCPFSEWTIRLSPASHTSTAMATLLSERKCAARPQVGFVFIAILVALRPDVERRAARGADRIARPAMQGSFFRFSVQWRIAAPTALKCLCGDAPAGSAQRVAAFAASFSRVRGSTV